MTRRMMLLLITLYASSAAFATSMLWYIAEALSRLG